MQQYEVSMDKYNCTLSVKVWAENKAKATYKAFTMWRGKELDKKCTFSAFVRYFYKVTIKI